MAFKIEGVICHGKDHAVFRKIKFVTLLVEITAEERKESMDVKVDVVPFAILRGHFPNPLSFLLKHCLPNHIFQKVAKPGNIVS